MARRKIDPQIELLLTLIDESYEKRAWHGPNLRGSIRGLSLATAAYRPASKRRNIWEIVVHAAYWKYVVRRRLLGEQKGSFPLQGSNWFERPERPTAQAWRDDLKLLDAMHRSVRDAVASLSAAELDSIPPGSKLPHRTLITGIAFHDVYHAGQIQLLKRLARKT